MLGSRPLGPLLWHACSQTTLSVGVYGIYALTNAWFVARGVGADALAAVNLAAPVLLILGAVSTTVGVGGASVVSRRLGAHDPGGAARAAGNAMAVFWLVAAVITVVGLVGLDPLLSVLGAGDSTRGPARAYAEILLAGALVSTGFSSLVRAEGHLRFSTALWVVPVLVQITLDPLLIFGLDWGVRGAAVGTVGGQAVSAAMSLWFFFVRRDRPYRIGLADLRPHGPTVRALVGVGAPSFLAGFGTTVLAALVNHRVSAEGGAVALAAYAVCVRVQTFVAMPHLGISQGLQPIVGYNAGRRRFDRVLRARTLALRSTIGYGAVAGVAIALLAGPLVGVFLPEGDAATTGRQALRVIAIGFVAAGITPLVSAYTQALGRPAVSYGLAIGTLVAVRVPLVLILSSLGTSGIWVALAIGEFVSAAIALVLLRTMRASATPDSSV